MIFQTQCDQIDSRRSSRTSSQSPTETSAASINPTDHSTDRSYQNSTGGMAISFNALLMFCIIRIVGSTPS
tara:strand:- start:251 stop:463 length:213 start_codon:yes stop_codon:yes gene_type:complete